jgi:transcriptional regulator with XRE-family HTH domain
MGRTTKELRKPKRLGEKLAAIRRQLQLSQSELIRKLGFADELVREEVSSFERGVRVPPVIVLLEYARVANVLVEWLIDDDVDLPEQLPSEALPKWVSGQRKAGLKRKPKN